MEFKEGATVRTRDGDKVGTVDHIVIDPATNEVTHIVIEKGFLFTEDRVLPVASFSGADDGTVSLISRIDDVEDFPMFEETHYISPDTDDYRVASGEFAPLFYYPPVGAEPYTRYPGALQPAVKEKSRNIPADNVSIDEGTSVTTADGDHAGHVEKVFTDQADHITHILISRGFIFTTERLVPINWVRWMTDNESS